MASTLTGPPAACTTIDNIPAALKENAAQFLVYTDWYCDSGYEYYNTFMNDYWNPFIYTYIIQPYGQFVFTIGIGIAAVANLGYTFYTDSGANNIAVFATMAKSVLADQSLPGGYTLYGLLDSAIAKTARGGVPAEGEEEGTAVEGEEA